MFTNQFPKGDNWPRWIGLVNSVGVSHLVLVYPKKCIRPNRRSDRHLLI